MLKQAECPNTRLFSHSTDIAEYKRICSTLMSISSTMVASICKEIAEYATGRIIKCDNYARCQNEILFLYEDKLKPSKQREFRYHKSFQKDGKKRRQFFCNLCRDTLVVCGYQGCKTMYVANRYGERDCENCDGDNVTDVCYDHPTEIQYCSNCDSHRCSEHDFSWCGQCDTRYCECEYVENDDGPEYCGYCHSQLCRQCREIKCNRDGCKHVLCKKCFETQPDCGECNPSAAMLAHKELCISLTLSESDWEMQ
eukprot:445247_1